MRGLRSTLVLLVVAVGLGVYIYFVESKKEPSSDLPKKEKVFTIEADKVQEVRVKSESGDTTTVRKSGDAWQVVEPTALEADQAEMSSITSNLASLEMQRVVDANASDLAGYGLAKPRVEVAFKAAGDKDDRRLLLGDKTATGGDIYAKLASDKKVFLVSGYLDSTFNKTTFDLRDKSALKFDRDKVDSLTVETAEHTVQAVKQGGEWKLAQPVQARADYGTVEGILGRLNTAQMKSIVTADARDLKEYGLDKPVATATLAAGSARAALQIGKATADGVYARDAARPAVFTVESSLVDELKKAPGDYRRKDVFEFRPFNAARLEIVREGKTYAFEKVKGTGKEANTDKWRQVAPAARDVDASKMDTLLSRLSNLRAQSFVDARTVLDKPDVTVVARYDDNKKQERVVFGKSGTDVHAGRAEEPGAAKIDSNEYNEALKALDEVLK